MTVGERIKELRQEKGYTLLQLAEQIGVSEATMQRYESGKIKSISPDTLSKLADALGTTGSWLLGEHEQTAKNAVTVELSSTESMLLKMYRAFSSSDKDIIRSMIMRINESRLKEYEMERRLEYAERFIDGTEYASDYITERDEYLHDSSEI